MKKILLFFFISQLIFSQSPTTLEEKIYTTVDEFVAHPNEQNLKKLSVTEATFKPKSKPELLALVILKCNKAYYENQFGNTQQAIISYEKAWQLFQKNQLTNYDIVASCLQPLGNLYTIIGDYDNAENTIKQYYFIANVEKNQQQKYAAILNLSNVYQNTGRIVEAINLLEKTLQTEKLSNAQKGNLWNNLGANYFIQNQFSLAKKAIQNAIQSLKNDSSQTKTLSNAYRNLAKMETQENHLEKAKELMEQSRDLFFENPIFEPRQQAQLYYDIALLDFQSTNFDESQINLKAVFSVLIPNYNSKKSLLPNKNSLYAETVLLDAFDLQAELFLAQNQPKKALQSYQLAFHIEALFTSMLVYENSKIIHQLRNRNRTEKCININYLIHQKEKKSQYIETAFLLAEKTKSAVLKQSLSTSKTQSRSEKLIVQQLQNWNTIIVKEQQKLDNADISKINEAIKKQNELMLLLKSKDAKTTNQSNTTLDLETLSSKLEKDKSVLIEYFIGNENSYVFTIENNAIQLQRLSKTVGKSSEIRDFLSFFNEANAIANNPNEYNRQANSVYALLQLPKSKTLKNLIIVPDGILNFLPFEALITKKSTTTNFEKMLYLVHDFKISYTNSVEFYLNTIPFQHKKETVLGVFPIFENTVLELAFSKNELINLKATYDGKYLDKHDATFENFRRNAANYSVLHLSTHADSGDIFEPASLQFYDQKVLYSELYPLNMHPDLVVLSACETGVGKLFKAEGAMSVARGFQFAGAQNLLFSLWKVNDYTTSVFMEKFYANVKKGDSYSDANYKAKLDFLADETIPNAKKSPYYWSAFVYYGTLEQKESTTYFLYIGVLLVVAISLFLLFRKYKK
jgi:CHAT domain-containing protein